MLTKLAVLCAALSLTLGGTTRTAAEQSRQIEEKLLAPCCYSENVALHNSEVAAKLRAEIGRFVAEGKTEAWILDHYKAEYGTRVLAEPDGISGRWLNVIPVVLTLTAAILLAILIYRAVVRGRKANAALASASPAANLPDIDDLI